MRFQQSAALTSVSDLKKHGEYNDHKFALEAICLQQSSNTVSGYINCTSTHAEAAVICAMRNVYWLASEDIASVKYNSLNELVTFQGCSALKDLYVGENAKFTHHQIVEEMQQCIADCIKEKIIADAQASPAIGIMTDESTDISVTKSLVIYIWYLHPIHKQYKTSFLSLTEVPSGTADVIAEAIKKELSSSAIPLAKCCGFSSDGAKVLVGKQNGVAALLKRENTCMIDVHCIAHRLALASSQSSESYPEAVRFQKQLSAVYAYFAHSAVRMHKNGACIE